MTNIEIPAEIAALKGQALKDRAKEMDVPGRSKMSVQELREAIAREMSLDSFLQETSESALKTLSENVDVEAKLADVKRRAAEAESSDGLPEDVQAVIDNAFTPEAIAEAEQADEAGMQRLLDAVLNHRAPATPLSMNARHDNFTRQTGSISRLTPKQARRLRQKAFKSGEMIKGV